MPLPRRPAPPSPRPTKRNGEAPTTLSDGAMKLLQKIAKGIKGEVPVREFAEVAPLLGWGTVRVLAPRPGVSRESFAALEAALAPEGYLSGSAMSAWGEARITAVANDPDARGFLPSAVAAKVKAALDAMTASLTRAAIVLPKKAAPPARVGDAQRGAVFLAELGPSKTYGGGALEAKVWTVAEGDLVTVEGRPLGMVWLDYGRLKGGGSVELPTAAKPGSVWTWVYKAGGQALAAAAITQLGDDGTRRRKPEHPEGDHNTGICQICERRQKLRYGFVTGLPAAPGLVDHGYQHESTVFGRSSYGVLGQRVGKCFGVDAQPWELDSSRLRAYRDSVARQLDDARKFLADLRAGRVVELNGSVRDPAKHRLDYRKQFVDVTLTPASTVWPEGVYSWADLVKRRIVDVDAHVRHLEQYLARIDGRLASWKRQPLYDELHPPPR